MKRFKGFGARFNFEKGEEYVKSAVLKIASPQCLPGLKLPLTEATPRRSVDDSWLKKAVELQSASTPPDGDSASTRDFARRRSVDDSHRREREDSQAVRGEFWKANPPATSSSDSFSSASDMQSSSRPSDASAVSFSDAIHPHARDGESNGCITVVGFDARAREAGVNATVLWTIRNVVRKGDVLVLIGVLDYIRGPLGYKILVDDQTWLGANQNALRNEIHARNMSWQAGLKKLSEDAGVKLVVDVKAAARAEVAIVDDAVALGAVHVVLDKSLHNRRRRYYLERLSCDVTRMRRSGGVDSIRSLASIASDREKRRSITSPTSVLIPSRPSTGALTASEPALSDGNHTSSFSASLSRLMKFANEKSVVASSSSSGPAIEEADELFSIDPASMSRRISMLLESELDRMDHRGDQLAVDDEGYISDDLFSLVGDGASRRPSIGVFTPLDQQPQSVCNSVASVAARPSYDFSRLSLDSGPRLDKRLLFS